jgi:hypothetical protein
VASSELAPNVKRISNVLRYTMEAVRKVSNERWRKVIRGAVDWADFPFDQYPTACAVLMDECTLLRRKNRGMLTLEFMMKMPANVDESQDEMLDLMRSDAVRVWEVLAACDQVDPDEPGMPLTFMVDASSDSSIEVSDASLKIQGIVATVAVEM